MTLLPFDTREQPLPQEVEEEIALGALPFVVEHLRLDEKNGGYFTPAAQVVVTGALRTGGLLRQMRDDEARTLLALLTFLTANGRIHPTAAQLAEALSVGEGKAKERLRRLCALSWQGKPVAFPLTRAVGQDAISLSRFVLGERDANTPSSSPATTRSVRLPLPAPPDMPAISMALPAEDTPVASREAVVSHSREAYARPRAEVEREILVQLGHAAEEADDTPEGAVRRRLAALGVPREQADLLFAHHTLEEITAQIDWLPYRNAHSPARYVVAAIQGRYEPPARVRWEQDIAVVKDAAQTSEGAEQTAKTDGIASGEQSLNEG
jgi:hypothetical protein